MGTGCGRPEVAAKRIYNYLQLPSFIAENTLMATIKVIQNGRLERGQLRHRQASVCPMSLRRFYYQAVLRRDSLANRL
jgi:hypothetical protein